MSRWRYLPILLCAALWPAAASAGIGLADLLSDPSPTELPIREQLPWIRYTLKPAEGRMPANSGAPAIAYQVLAPGDYGFRSGYHRNQEAVDVQLFANTPPAYSTPAGSVLILHGWGHNGTNMLPWGVLFADAGYQSVLVDLRSHGGSGRAPPGYGPREAQDMLRLIAHLEARGQLPRPLILFGVSYGAATALFTAARAEAGVERTIALEPYGNAAEGMFSMAKGAFTSPSINLTPTEAFLVEIAKSVYDDAQIRDSVAKAGARLALDLNAIDTAEAVRAIEGCVLLVHGAKDDLIPVESSRRLRALKAGIGYLELPEEDHLTLPMRFDWLNAPLREWLARERGDCRAPDLPADPALADYAALHP